MTRFRKYRKGHIGNWVLLGKIWTKRANCHVCSKELHGEQLIYTHLTTKESIAVCHVCVKEFEKVNSNPVAKRKKFIVVSVSGDAPILSDKVCREYKRKWPVRGIDTWSLKRKEDFFNKTGIMI